MNRLNLLYIILIISLSFVLLQCEKNEPVNDKNTEELYLDFSKANKSDLKEYLVSKGYNASETDENSIVTNNTNACFTPDANCFTVDKIDTIFIQGYCGDSVKAVVEYTITICPYSGPVFIIDRAYPIECQSLIVYWAGLSDVLLDEELDKFWHKASLVVEEKFVRENLPPFFSCPNYAMNTSVYSHNCYQWCLVVNSKPGGDVLMGFYKLFCGEKCCVRTRSFCWDNNGKLKVSDPTYTPTGNGQCDDQSGGICRNGTLVGECERQCGEP